MEKGEQLMENMSENDVLNKMASVIFTLNITIVNFYLNVLSTFFLSIRYAENLVVILMRALILYIHIVGKFTYHLKMVLTSGMFVC